jgi:hypothetical protein
MTVVVVGGALANKARNGGEAWVRLSWVRGLERLGFEVYLLEEIGAGAYADEAGRPCALEESVNWDFFRSVVRRFGLEDRSALWDHGSGRSLGMSASALDDLSRDASLLVNISGHVTLPTFLGRVPRRAYVDLDPGFTQFWAAQGLDGARLEGHDAFFTVGERIGHPDCPIPTLGLAWRAVRQPVVLDDWEPRPSEACSRLTTVASWRGAFSPLTHDGVTYGVKAHEFRKYLAAPGQVEPELEIALAIDGGDAEDLSELRRHGWTIVDPVASAADPDAFRHYVAQSDGEFSVAQGIYVGTRSGWFSDRSVRYLAAGKPVLLQDTGYSELLPTGHGLVPFRTLNEAVSGARRIVSDYATHALAARAIAEAYFDSDRVLSGFVDELGVPA